jgi:hypothetical protein
MACHYLDLFLASAAVAWLLDRILPAGGRPVAPAPGLALAVTPERCTGAAGP